MLSAPDLLLKAENCIFMARSADDPWKRRAYFRLAAIYRNRALRVGLQAMSL
jgi:hypothetical protein